MIVIGKHLLSVSRSLTGKLTTAKTIPSRPIMSSSLEAIREKFEKGVYPLYDLPSVLFMNYSGVYVNESTPYPDVVAELERLKSGAARKENVKTPKLRATSYGEWSSSVVMVRKEYFESREKLDEYVIETSDRSDGSRCTTADRIPLQEALKAMIVDLSINMEYYLQNLNDLDADLGHKVSDSLQLNNEPVMRKLEQELFYKMMCKLFGNENADDQVDVDGKETLYEKSFTIRNFKILSFDGNSMLATASRDDHYLLMFFDY